MPQHSNHRSPRKRRQKERPWVNTWGDNSWKLPKMRKEIATEVQEAQRVPNRINWRQNTLRHILIKLTKIKHKEQILKPARENKKQLTHKGIPIRITSDISIQTLQARREWLDILKVWKRKTHNPDYRTQQGSHSNMKEKLKALQTTKAQRIQCHQTGSPTNAKGSSLDRKHRKGL